MKDKYNNEEPAAMTHRRNLSAKIRALVIARAEATKEKIFPILGNKRGLELRSRLSMN